MWKLTMTVRIKPGALYNFSSTEFSKYTLSKKLELKKWYQSAVGYVPNGYKNCPWVEIRKGNLPSVLERLNKLKYSRRA